MHEKRLSGQASSFKKAAGLERRHEIAIRSAAARTAKSATVTRVRGGVPAIGRCYQEAVLDFHPMAR
jgi:hypothetical protein